LQNARERIAKYKENYKKLDKNENVGLKVGDKVWYSDPKGESRKLSPTWKTKAIYLKL
jgi:hypothetical protein